MARTPSNMLPLGTPAPHFSLPDVDGRTVALDDVADAPALVVIFLCAHCPYVIHVKTALAALAREVQAQGAAVVAIQSNDIVAYPVDAPAMMKQDAEHHGYTFPILHDDDQSVAMAYQAACTPDFYVFDAERRLTYRGQFDSSRPANDLPVTGDDLRAAVLATLAGEPVSADQQPSLGCNIKWKPGNEPRGVGLLNR